jgi:hypothetical protein
LKLHFGSKNGGGWAISAAAGRQFLSVRSARHGQIHLAAAAVSQCTIEVKRSARVASADLKGLRAFRADYPEAQGLLLSFCPEPLLIDGIRCEPLEGWLRQLRP